MGQSLLSGQKKVSKSEGKVKEKKSLDFPGGTVDKNPPADAGDVGLVPGPRRSHLLWNNLAHVPHCWARKPRACAPQQERLPKWEARAPQQGVVPTCHN